MVINFIHFIRCTCNARVITRFVNGIAKHPDLKTDPSFVDFLEVDGDLPRATSTSALSSAGVLRLFSRVGDSLGKITYKMDEADVVIMLISLCTLL